MQLSKNTTTENIHLEYYSAMNGLLKLTKVELAVLVEFCKIVSDNKIFDSSNRKLVSSKLGMSIYNLNNYIRILKDKKMFIEVNNVLDINPSIRIDARKDFQEVHFKFNVSN